MRMKSGGGSLSVSLTGEGKARERCVLGVENSGLESQENICSLSCHLKIKIGLPKQAGTQNLCAELHRGARKSPQVLLSWDPAFLSVFDDKKYSFLLFTYCYLELQWLWRHKTQFKKRRRRGSPGSNVKMLRLEEVKGTRTKSADMKVSQTKCVLCYCYNQGNWNPVSSSSSC